MVTGRADGSKCCPQHSTEHKTYNWLNNTFSREFIMWVPEQWTYLTNKLVLNLTKANELGARVWIQWGDTFSWRHSSYHNKVVVHVLLCTRFCDSILLLLEPIEKFLTDIKTLLWSRLATSRLTARVATSRLTV